MLAFDFRGGAGTVHALFGPLLRRIAGACFRFPGGLALSMRSPALFASGAEFGLRMCALRCSEGGRRPTVPRICGLFPLPSSRPAGTGRISDVGLPMSEGGRRAVDNRYTVLARSAAGPWPARSRAFCGRFPNVKPPRRTKCVGAAGDVSVGRAGRRAKPPAVRSVPRDYFVVLRASSQAASGILAMRATWRSPSNGVAMNSSRNSRAWSLVMKRAGSTSTLASLC